MVENSVRWRELCERAETEKDPVRLKILIEEIFALVEERQKRPAANLAAKERPRTPVGLGNL
jgi:hypothetical protein